MDWFRNTLLAAFNILIMAKEVFITEKRFYPWFSNN